METEKQKFRIAQKIAWGHMAWPQQVGEWSTASKVVFKKDDKEGRWIFDFRPLNAVTKKNLSRTVDVMHTIQDLAKCLWKTTLDAWARFNQVKATERAKELMQILTVAGVLQWEVMPFGVTNGPAVFQNLMDQLFQGLLGDAMSERIKDATLGVFMDDVGIGSGKYDEGLTDDNDDSFDQHIVLLEVVLVRSQEANLTFSMRKAFFAQWVVTQLGHEVGWGYIAPDPARTTQIAGWPRPQSREDVEHFLACMNFMRTMMCPSLAEKSAPLRVAVKELQRARSPGYKTKFRAKGTAPTLAPDEWPELWTEEMEESLTP